MKGSLLFNKDITYDEYLKIVQDSLSGQTAFLASRNMIKKGVESLLQLDDIEKREKVISCSIEADKLLSPAYSREKNIDKKIPVVLTIGHLVNDYYNDVKDLKDKELVLSALLNSFVEPHELENNIAFSSNKKLLSTVIKKTNDIIEQMNILSVIEESFEKQQINKNDKASLNNFISNSILFIENNSKEEILSYGPTNEDITEILIRHNL